VIDLLRSIWQADSGFPSGSFAFSGGLEGFYALAPDADAAALSAVLYDLLAHRWATGDRVALAQAHRAGHDLAAIARADAAVDAATLVEPLREGSRRNGMALLAAHERLGTAPAASLRDACREGRCLGHLAVMQGALFRALGLDLPAAIATAGYAAAAALVTASVRLGRIGAIEGQRALADVLPLLAALARQPPAPDARPEGFVPLLDIAAARQTRASMRLFAS
jgi:urease accessory protein